MPAPESPSELPAEVDVLIVGAGLSGIGAAHHLQARCPGKTYLILEGRERLGGTWDLFRYPGIRSDSDMYTLGYSFRPWTSADAIAGGDEILAYLRATAEASGIDRRIRYRQRVERARWSSADGRWTTLVRDGATGALRSIACRFLYLCVGYYDYDEGYTPSLPGRERFTGRIVHPQQWAPDIDYDGKRVVVIGSGATAVTLVPALARRAAHVTMLQRSPTYILSRPRRDPVLARLEGKVPARVGYLAARWKSVLLGIGFFQLSRRYPERVKRFLVGQVARQLRGAAEVAPHFTPAYNPWDQRLCLVPDGDLFEVLRDGRASVVTDHIETFTETGLALRSGAQLPADLVVTATGLRLKALGGIDLEVDGARIDPARLMVYKGVMCSDVPNLAFAAGYTNASWTLKAELSSAYVCRLLQYMDAHGYTVCCPRRVDPSVGEVPIMDLASGYVQRASDQLPKQGTARPWRLYQNYVLDRAMLELGRIEDPALELSRPGGRSPGRRPNA
jgi:cation diffusion facilitator CzcD-associated flavoprotein CzcO